MGLFYSRRMEKDQCIPPFVARVIHHLHHYLHDHQSNRIKSNQFIILKNMILLFLLATNDDFPVDFPFNQSINHYCHYSHISYLFLHLTRRTFKPPIVGAAEWRCAAWSLGRVGPQERWRAGRATQGTFNGGRWKPGVGRFNPQQQGIFWDIMEIYSYIYICGIILESYQNETGYSGMNDILARNSRVCDENYMVVSA